MTYSIVKRKFLLALRDQKAVSVKIILFDFSTSCVRNFLGTFMLNLIKQKGTHYACYEFFLLLGCELALTSCASTPEPNSDYNYKLGKPVTLAKKQDDLLDCRVQAARAVPVNNKTMTTPRYTVPVYTSPVNCNTYGNVWGGSYSGSTTCYGGQTTGGQTYGGDVYTVDANLQLRNQFQTRCMRQKRYLRTKFPIPECRPEQIPIDFINEQSLVHEPIEGACAISSDPRASIILLPSQQLLPNK